MKKFVVALLLAAVFAADANAEVVGVLSKVNITEENFSYVSNAMFRNASPVFVAILAAEGVSNPSPRFYNSLSLLQLALNKGEIDSIGCPDFVGEYMLKHSQEYSLRAVRF